MNERDFSKAQAKRLLGGPVRKRPTQGPPVAVERAAEGRAFIAIGPNVWGRGATDAEAIANARKEYGRGRAGFRCILFDADVNTWVDEMGMWVYTPKEGVEPYREVRRIGMPAAK